MAWIAKNSATMQIDSRDEPYLDDTLKQELESQILTRYPTRRAATLPVLHAVQHRYNYIPHQALEEAANYLKISAAEMIDAASLYEEVGVEAKGK